MKNFKKTQLIRVSKLVLIAITMVFISCSSNEDNMSIKVQSITAANFQSITSSSDNGYSNIQIGESMNNNFKPIIKVQNYNTAYNYTIVLKGDYLDNEYSAALTFDETNDGGDAILKFDMTEFDAVPDTYQAYILEEDSNTEIKIENLSSEGEKVYYVYDTDHSEYLYDLFFKVSDSDYSIPSSISKSAKIAIGYPFSPNYSSGLKLEMVVRDTDFNELGRVDIHTTGGSGYTNIFYGSDLSFITERGDYIFQVEGIPKTAESTKTLRKSTYKTMTVTVSGIVLN